jgi:hypothetical protein
MTKINFDNRHEDRDKQLIQLLRDGIKEFPSDQLVESTMTRISAIHAEKKFAYKPLRSPLYIMATIIILLLAPFFVPMVSNGASLNPLSVFLDYPESLILKYAVWCWLVGVALRIFRILLPVQWKFDLTPFKP